MPASADFEILAAAVALASLSVVYGASGFLQLERAFPPTHRVELDSLRARDGLRHARILQALVGVVDFPVGGSSDPYYGG